MLKQQPSTPNPLRGEVWYVDIGRGIGDEMMKIRPAVVISRDALGSSLDTKLVVPMTEWQDWFQGKPWLTKVVKTEENGLKKDSAASGLQVTSVSTSRFTHKLGVVTAQEMMDIVASVKIVIS